MPDDITIREFTRQAASFETPGTHFGDGGVLGWIAGEVPLGPEDRVLDVAGGTGQLGRHLARSARFAVVADLTPAMLARGSEAVREQGRTDVVYVRADATALPFADGQFEVVATRFALHHIDDVPAALAEMRRVCAPGGSVTVVDIVTEDGPLGERFDELQRLRDPSHGTTPRPGTLAAQMRAAGLEPIRRSVRDEPLSAQDWLDRGGPEPAAGERVLGALRAEAAGGEPTGLRAAIADGELTIIHRYLLLRATVPQSPSPPPRRSG